MKKAVMNCRSFRENADQPCKLSIFYVRNGRKLHHLANVSTQHAPGNKTPSASNSKPESDSKPYKADGSSDEEKVGIFALNTIQTHKHNVDNIRGLLS